MKNKILYAIIGLVFIVAMGMTFFKGINVDIYYGEGYRISFTEKNTISISDIETIAKEIWGSNYSVQKLEFFNDSAEIKVKDYNDEQIINLKNKLNEKYGSELEESSFKIEHVTNVRLRNILSPYIIPVILSFVIVMIFYAIRYRGARKMLELLAGLLIFESLFYSIYAIGRIPFSAITMPLAMSIYVIVTLGFTTYNEIKE